MHFLEKRKSHPPISHIRMTGGWILMIETVSHRLYKTIIGLFCIAGQAHRVAGTAIAIVVLRIEATSANENAVGFITVV